jgi:PTS system ascorbate-specific IIA component
MGEPTTADLLPAEAIALGAEAADWRAAVAAAGERLVATGAATPAYTDEMVRTVEEHGPYIVLAPGLALAHARPSPSVLRTGLSLVTLAAPVEFGHAANDPVRLVIGLAAVDADQHTGALARLARVLADDARRAALTDAASAAEARDLLTGAA